MPLIDIDAKNKAEEQSNPDLESANPRLTACAECGHQVSRRALTCPNCAAVLRKAERDPVLLGVLLVVAAGFLIAGLWTIYAPATLLGGDAYNYMVAADRGIGLIGVGVALVIVAFGLHISQATHTIPVGRFGESD